MYQLDKYRFVVATTPQQLQEIYRLRYQIYVEEFGFEKAHDHPHQMETDEWDPFSIHMAALDPDDRVIGTIRLVINSARGLPTLQAAQPFFQDKNPASRRIAEISRLAVARSFRRRVEDGLYGMESYLKPKDGAYVFHNAPEETPSQERRKKFVVVLGLFRIMYHVSKRMDLTDWYMMSEKRLWYMLKRYNIVFHEIGPEMDYHGKRVPYVGHVSEIEIHMLKVNQNMARSFMEGAEGGVAKAS